MIPKGQGGTMNRCFVAVDFVNDFITGKLGSENAEKSAQRAFTFLESIPKNDTIIFTLDTHPKGDKEFKLWGEHCVKDTWGSELWSPMEKIDGVRLRKGNYDAFFKTDLEEIVCNLNTKDLYIFGISTDICVQSTVAGAFFRGFNINVIEDLSASLRDEDHRMALENMVRLYGARILNSEELK